MVNRSVSKLSGKSSRMGFIGETGTQINTDYTE